MKNKISYKIFRRVAAILLIAVLLFSVAACNGKTEDVTLPEKKVAILVAPEAQYPEDYKAAAELAEKCPDNVVVKEYSDSRILRAGDAEIIQYSRELAENEEIGAIIYARATQFTTNAISAAKEINSDIVTVCIEPEESINKLSDLADLVYCVDWAKATNDIVAAAKEQGAKYFVVFSINRHIGENPLITAENTAFKTACEAQGLTYIYDSSIDPIFSSGIAGAKKYIRESVARLYSNEKIVGSDVALFSTDSSVQSTLVEVANERGLIYVCPSFPTAYNGAGEAYEITKPESIFDVKTYIENAAGIAAADTEGKARICMYKFPLASTFLKAALYNAFDILNGTITAENLAEKAIEKAKAVADNKDFSVEAYSDTALTNTFMAYCPGFEKIK